MTYLWMLLAAWGGALVGFVVAAMMFSAKRADERMIEDEAELAQLDQRLGDIERLRKAGVI